MDVVRLAAVGAVLAAGCTSTPADVPSMPAVARPQLPDTPPPPAPGRQTAAAAAAGAPRQGRDVALVGPDAVITDDEVWQMVRHRRAEFEKLDEAARPARETAVFREELRRLVERELVIAELMAKLKKNKPQAVDEIREQVAGDAQRELKRVRKNLGNPPEADFDAILSGMRMTQKGYLRQVERTRLMNIYLGQYLREKKREASLAEVRRYYDDHPGEFAAEDRVKWLDLFLAAGLFPTPEACRQAAAGLANQARAGADFVQLVKQHGHGDSKLRDGEGVGAKRGEVRPADLEAAVFAVPAGGVSDPLPTDTGYHVVKVLEREVAGRKPFDAKVQAAIRAKLLDQFQEAEVGRLIDELWRKTAVEFVGVP